MWYKTKEEFRAELMYQTTMSIARDMIKKGTITEDEYKLLEDYFEEKYHPLLGKLMSSISLTKLGNKQADE